MDQLSDSYTKVSRSAVNLKILLFIRFCMADKLNGQGIKNIKIEISKITALRDTLVCDSENRSTYYFGFAPVVFYFCVWPSFIGAALAVIKVYSVRLLLKCLGTRRTNLWTPHHDSNTFFSVPVRQEKISKVLWNSRLCL